MEDDILKFIDSFSEFGEQVIKLFTKRHCYGFSLILLNNFKNGRVFWDRHNGHSVFELEGVFYDITGVTYPSIDLAVVPVKIEEDVCDWVL